MSHPLEEYFDTRSLVHCPVYRRSGAKLFFVNPSLYGESLGLPWWADRYPPLPQDVERLLEHCAITVTPLDGQKPIATLVAFDAGRTVLCEPSPFRCSGRLYRDISLKGVGPITAFTGSRTKTGTPFAPASSPIPFRRSELTHCLTNVKLDLC